MITGLLYYIAGAILAYILGAIWNDYLCKWLKIDAGRWEIYTNSLCFLSVFTVIIWFLLFIFALISKIVALDGKPTFKIKKH